MAEEDSGGKAPAKRSSKRGGKGGGSYGNGNGNGNNAGKGGGAGGEQKGHSTVKGSTTRPPFLSSPIRDPGLPGAEGKEREIPGLRIDADTRAEQLGGSYPVDANHTSSDYASLARQSERSRPTQSLVSARTGVMRGPRPPVRVRIIR